MISAFGVEHGEISKSFVPKRFSYTGAPSSDKVITPASAMTPKQRQALKRSLDWNKATPAWADRSPQGRRTGRVKAWNRRVQEKEATRQARSAEGKPSSPVKRSKESRTYASSYQPGRNIAYSPSPDPWYRKLRGT